MHSFLTCSVCLLVMGHSLVERVQIFTWSQNWVSGHFQAEITHCYYTMLSCNNPSWPESSSQWICDRQKIYVRPTSLGWAISNLWSFALSSLVACGCISVVGIAMLSLWWSGCQGCQRGCMSARVCVDVWDVRGGACQREFVSRSVCNKWYEEVNIVINNII